MPIRALIADDEAPARRRIRNLLRDRDEYQIVAEAKTGPEAVNAVRTHRPDLLFLDIQMPGLTGFEVLSSLDPGEVPITVFVTAYDDHAIRAFEAHAIDYLLKPFDDERFEAALKYAGRRLREREAERLSGDLRALLDHSTAHGLPSSSTRATFAVRKRDSIELVPAADIDWIEAAGDYVRLHAAGRAHLIRATLRDLEERLDPQSFLRIHRSTIVRSDRIERLIPRARGDYEVVLRDGTELRLSRTYRDRARTALGHEL
jgi:two-component system LytT family response regulator